MTASMEKLGVSEVKNEKDTRVMIEATNVKSSDEISSCGKRVRSDKDGSLYPLGSGVSNSIRGTIEWLCAIKNKAG
tara:strand:+ start:739 stop:966 length:228 start_codon:yes stop_codon:yes gene_type:complete